MKRRIVEAGGTIVLCLAAYLSYSIVSSSLLLSLAEPGTAADATFSDLSPDWIIFPARQLKWPKLHTFCAGLCTDEELMQ